MSATETKSLPYVVCLALLAVSCAGPSDDNNDVGTKSDVGADAATQPDMGARMDATTQPDVGPIDFGPDKYPVLTESEPNTSQDQATPFTQPAILTGNVNVDSDVFDWWEVDLAGPALLRITVQGGDLGWVEVQTPLASKRGMAGGPGATREFFVPVANRYQIGILATDDNPDVDYRIEVTSYEPTPIPLTDTSVMGDLDDSNVDVYSWTATGSGFTLVELFGERPPVSSGFDSFLFVYDDGLNNYVWNDDAMSGGTKDSRLDFERRDGGEYLIAVDMYEPTDDRRYELRLQPN